MTLEEATALVAKEKNSDQYISIHISWSQRYLFPQKEGILFLSALATAIELNYDPNKVPIKQKDSSEISVSFVSAERVRQMKVATLLNISMTALDDLHTSELQEAITT